MLNSKVKITELWLYPVKGCQGIRVPSAKLCSTGFELDRAWCFVDLDGIACAKNEAISPRRVPALGRIKVQFSSNKKSLILSTPLDGPRESLVVPVDENAYSEGDEIIVECSGKSTTTGGGWSLGFIKGTSAGKTASDWISDYLNEEVSKRRRRSGKAEKSRFALVRSLGSLSMEDYPPCFPILAKAKTDNSYKERFENNHRQFSDFAPLLLCNEASRRELMDKGNTGHYPMESFRASVIVDSVDLAFSEDTWSEIMITEEGSTPIVLKMIKPCPRCTVTCRDQETGEYLFKQDKLKLWKVLKKLYPLKAADPEWGTWAGPIFGCYFGNASQEGIVGESSEIVITKVRPWDAHLQSSFLQNLAEMVRRKPTLFAMLGVSLVALAQSRR